MKLIQSITKPVSEMFADQGSGHSEEESTKRKFIVTIKGADGSEVEKKCKAYSITDIKHHFGDKFVDAELHPDEKRYASDDEEDDDRTADEMDADAEDDSEPTRPMPKQRARNAAEAGRGPSPKDAGVQEAMTTPEERKKKDLDFQRLMAGAMTRDDFKKHDFDVEFAWTTTYSEPRDLYAAIKQHHGVEHADTERKQVGKSSTGRFGVVLATYYIVKKGTMDVLGRWTVTGADKIPGRGFVSYGDGNIAMSKKAIKNRDDNRYGFLIKPQHGSPYISVGTQHSHGPWDGFSAKANVQDKYQHFEYDDEFGHGTIQVVKVVKKDGKWVRA